jgi:alkylation response protein AidB-like acyl-CoA dehydrogenase
MISHVEANQAWLESLAYQLNNLTYKQQSKLLGGPLGLLKSFATRSAHEIADDAVNIFGGRGLTQTLGFPNSEGHLRKLILITGHGESHRDVQPHLQVRCYSRWSRRGVG